MRAMGCSKTRASETASRSPDFPHASVAHPITEPHRTISLYRFFGMVQISSVGFLPLSIWTSYFGLGQGLPENLWVELERRLHSAPVPHRDSSDEAKS